MWHWEVVFSPRVTEGDIALCHCKPRKLDDSSTHLPETLLQLCLPPPRRRDFRPRPLPPRVLIQRAMETAGFPPAGRVSQHRDSADEISLAIQVRLYATQKSMLFRFRHAMLGLGVDSKQ